MSVSRWIAANPDRVYAAFTTAAGLEAWQAPDDMTAKVGSFDHRVGGGYSMTLTYHTDERGKSSEREDRYTARFLELVPNERIVEAITFETDDPAFMGEMTMTVVLEANGDGTLVTLVFGNLPSGIDPKDNDEGSRQSLANLARYVERDAANR
jgi:uncharacterized protein YndB with AHSA1/START domain